MIDINGNRFPIKPTIGPYSLKVHPLDGQLFCVNCYDHSLFIIDIHKKVILNRIDVGKYPCEIDIDWQNRIAYITNGDSNTLSIIDLDQERMVSQLPLGELPQGLIYNGKREELYVANMYENRVSIIDCTQLVHRDSIEVDSCPAYVLLSPDQGFLFVSLSQMESEVGGSIAVIDLEMRRIVKRIDVGKIPRQMTISTREEVLFVVNSTSNSISLISIGEGRELGRIRTGIMPRGIALDRREKTLFTTNIGDSTLSVISREEGRILKNIPIGKIPNGIAYLEL